jgi:hypothetical protein
MEVSGKLHALVALPGGTPPGTNCIGGWVGPRAGLDAVKRRKISCPCRESNPSSFVVQYRIMGSLINDELEIILKQAVVAHLKALSQRLI